MKQIVFWMALLIGSATLSAVPYILPCNKKSNDLVGELRVDSVRYLPASKTRGEQCEVSGRFLRFERNTQKLKLGERVTFRVRCRAHKAQKIGGFPSHVYSDLKRAKRLHVYLSRNKNGSYVPQLSCTRVLEADNPRKK